VPDTMHTAPIHRWKTVVAASTHTVDGGQLVLLPLLSAEVASASAQCAGSGILGSIQETYEQWHWRCASSAVCAKTTLLGCVSAVCKAYP
jgi:hypothetical protein